MRTIPAADANREFSKLLRDVSHGETVVVTSRGRPVARISPVGEGDLPGRDNARVALLMRLRGQPAIGASWTRDELYEG